MTAIRCAAAALFFAGALGGAAFAQSAPNEGCRLVVESGSDNWLIAYDPFSQNEVVRNFDITIVNQGEAPCAGMALADLRGEPFGLAMVGAGRRLPYILVDQRSGADITPRTGRTTPRAMRRPIHLGSGERALLRFSFAIAPEEILAAGVYSQDALISIEDATGMVLAQKPVALGVEVEPAAVMGLKGRVGRVSGVATIELGELREGPRDLGATLYVLSTGSYAVSVESANNGRLRQGATDWYVNYRLFLADRAINLASGDQIEVSSRRARADDYPLRVIIGEVAGRRAGAYTDVLTLTVAAH
ncbi:MAG TPA: hypothetical protein PLS69_05530 [Terricaulis sp.]|nr:hypothetical protein [Terricaulis sp.]HRP10458.1 hypothetical protein [Terricaulis sp.]